MLLLQHWRTSSLGGQIRTQHVSGGSITLILLVFALRVHPRGRRLLRKERKPTTTLGQSGGKHSCAAAQRSIHQVETVSRCRQQIEKTFSAENSCCDTPVAPSCPNPHGISRQTNKQRAMEEHEPSINSMPHRSKQMFIEGVVFGVTATTLRAPHCSHYGGQSMLIRQLMTFSP